MAATKGKNAVERRRVARAVRVLSGAVAGTRSSQPIHRVTPTQPQASTCRQDQAGREGGGSEGNTREGDTGQAGTREGGGRKATPAKATLEAGTQNGGDQGNPGAKRTTATSAPRRQP
jgi:hypothetical protein